MSSRSDRLLAAGNRMEGDDPKQESTIERRRGKAQAVSWRAVVVKSPARRHVASEHYTNSVKNASNNLI